jgi:hypothetical protein
LRLTGASTARVQQGLAIEAAVAGKSPDHQGLGVEGLATSPLAT